MCGEQQYLLFPTMAKRITPACAGNSCIISSIDTKEEDHPRVCGEQNATPQMGAVLNGSPPRVRGTVGLVAFGWVFLRITPACAGNSFL